MALDKLVDSSQLDADLTTIANAIRAKTGESGTMTVAQMPSKINAISTKENITWHQCPQLVRDYLEDVTYNPNDYTTSQIANYAPATAVSSNTKPVGKTVDGVTYYNEVPNVATPFASANMAGTVKPLDALRWLNTTYQASGTGSYPLGVNTRDLGGWACDGGHVKYGMLVRGGEPNAVDKSLMVEQIGIKSELYLLPISEQRSQTSAWGIDLYYNPTQDDYIWYSLSKTDLWKYYLRVVFDSVTHGKPLYFHCGIGADRTGTIAVMLEALLGMSQSDIDKDYELTNFYIRQDATSPRTRNTANYANYIAAIKAFPLEGGLTDTFRNHAVSFALSLGFTIDEINAYRTAMIDGTPTAITVSMDSYTVTNTLTHVTSDNDAVSVDEYQPYEANITPDSGYVISSVGITMGGVNVTAQYWNGHKTTFNNSVTNTLSNCTTDNNRYWIINGQSYAANISADSGYTLEGATVSITMGGVDMSTYYSNGKIAIPNVTGDIVINIEAVQSAPPHVNLLTMNDNRINKRISSDGLVDANGFWASDDFAVDLTSEKKLILKNGTAHIGNLGTTTYGSCKIEVRDASHNRIATWYMRRDSASAGMKFTDVNGDMVCNDITADCGSAQLGTKPSDWSTVKFIMLSPAYNNAATAISSASQITSAFEIYME